jgi:parallel beta-helix repeat protein
MRPALLVLALAACTSDDTEIPVDNDNDEFPVYACAPDDDRCIPIADGDVDGLLEAVNSLEDDMTVILAKGRWDLDNQVTIRGADGIRFVGQGIDDSVLSLTNAANQVNGVDVIGDRFTIEDLTIEDAPKDGLRIEDSDHVVIRRVKATWSNGPSPDNGAYGLYPVKSNHVLMEDSEAWYAADAGLYIGQCQHAIIRNNIAKGNVAGIEIENTQYADVYGNFAEDNTGGLLIFDLPGNPIPGRDIDVHDNRIYENNRPNFAPGGTVRAIPAGTGTFAMASRRVHIHDNSYRGNNTADIAIINGLAIEGSVDEWSVPASELQGDWEDLGLVEVADGVYATFRSHDVLVDDNEHINTGTAPDGDDPVERAVGFLLKTVYGDTPVDPILYDGIGESAFDSATPQGNSNDNRLCLDGAQVATLDLETLAERLEAFDVPTIDDLYRPNDPYVPYDCNALTDGPIVPPEEPTL